MASGKTPSPPAVERAFAILELLAQSRAGLLFSEVAERLDLPRSSVHCLLVGLERCGYAHRHARTGRYSPGMKLFTLANNALGGMPLRDAAMPLLRELCSSTGLTVHLGVLEQGEAVVIAKVEPGTGRLATWIGKRMELHCTSIGKALLAQLDEDGVRRILSERGLPRHNENTITGRQRLRDELARVREGGYAIDDEEDELGFRCIGVPVAMAPDQPPAAISVSGNISQVTQDNERALAQQLKQAAKAIAEQLLTSEVT